MSSNVASVVSVPRLAVTGKVTQMRVVVSEWTKLHSLRSTRWSLAVAVILTIGLPLLFATIVGSHWAHMSPQERANRIRSTSRSPASTCRSSPSRCSAS